ncbi:unnamed protein product [Blepharisma stoltei]|uniref:Uncharacterized protein n=1 Tax=Blepharisma stoltei TaxID=1481888 RepID=A0AAU9K8C7_9CILI|nr:unnamed protein product [Blepharisma stoltei]
MEKQHSKINTENKKEIGEIKAKIYDFSCDLSQRISDFQNLNKTCYQKIDELEKKISEKVGVESDKIKSELNAFVLKKSFLTEINNLSLGIAVLKESFLTEINNLSLGIAAVNQTLDTDRAKSKEIENKYKAEISKLNKIINEIGKEITDMAKTISYIDDVNQIESKLPSSIKKNAKIDAKTNPLEKSQPMQNISSYSPREKTSLSNSQMALEINTAAEECSNSKHNTGYHLSECPKTIVLIALKNILTKEMAYKESFIAIME